MTTFADFGRKGGSARTRRKRAAARANGKLGGRPYSRTLAEFLLRRKIPPEQQRLVEKAFGDLFQHEQEAIRKYFHVMDWALSPIYTDAFIPISRILNRDIRFYIKKFRLIANHLFAKARPPKPRIYWEWRHPSYEEEERWEARHESGIPCPSRKVRVDPTRLPSFSYMKWLFEHNNGKLSVAEICDGAGAQMTRRRAEILLYYLRRQTANKS